MQGSSQTSPYPPAGGAHRGACRTRTSTLDIGEMEATFYLPVVSLASLPPALFRAENDHTTVLREIFRGVNFLVRHMSDKQRKS